ncbi:MAG: hypothetical protein WC584_00890 [Candidatus Pacearchaeota archaeon]
MKIRNIFILSSIILVINLIWELSHYFLYIDKSGISPILHLLLASFTDMLIILGIFLIISLRNKSINWINKPKKNDYFLIIILGLITASIIEKVNLNLGRWAYTKLMPTIFGIGISPLIQLATTAIISIYIFRILNEQFL